MENLGPYAWALSLTTLLTESNRHPEDKIETGLSLRKERGGSVYNIGGVFLVWKGARMKAEQIEVYE